MNKRTSKWEKAQEGRKLENQCWRSMKPLLAELHQTVGRRLVKTMLDLILVIIMHRHRNNGLLLRELGINSWAGQEVRGWRPKDGMSYDIPSRK